MVPKARAPRRVKVLEKEEREVIRGIREACDAFVLHGLIDEAGGKLLRGEKAEEVEQAVKRALGELLFAVFAVTYRWSKGEESVFERRLREVQRLVQPVIRAAWWVLYDLAKKQPDFEQLVMQTSLL